MEHADTQSIALAVTFGGALIFGAFRLFSNFSAPAAITKDGKLTNVKDSSQKPKKAKKTEKKKANKDVSSPLEPKAVAISTKQPQPAVKTPAAEVTSQKKKAQEAIPKQKEKVPEPVEEVQPSPVVASKKKKSKKKKVKAPRPDVEEDSSSSEDEEIRAKQTKIPLKATPAPVPVPVKAPVQQVFEEFEEVDGWETVKVRRPKQTVGSTVPDVKALAGGATLQSTGAVSSAETGKGKKNKKEFKQTIEIGEFANVVLGEGGSTVSNIEQVSGARVTVNRDRSTCLVTGEEEAVAVATQMIQSLVSNQARIEMTLSSRLDKAIISKPDTKQKIRTLSGAKLDFKSGTAPSDPLIVVITGETEQVNTAEQLVKDYLAGKTPDGNDGIKRIQVSNFQAKIVIGPRGETISALQKETGANINVEFIADPSASGSDKGEESAVVTVIGSSEQIQSGTLAIQKFLAEHNYSTTIPLNSEARPGVLLRLNDLRRDIDNLNVELTEDRSSIMLQGSETGVKEGRSRVVRWIDDELGPPKINPGEVLSTLDLGGAAGKVIGRNRTMLNQLLKSNPGAKVEIKQGTTCYIYGQPNSVKKLFTDIEDIISKHEEVIAKTKQEEEELQNASWIVAGVQKDDTGANYAPESDWGGFKLAQFQGW